MIKISDVDEVGFKEKTQSEDSKEESVEWNYKDLVKIKGIGEERARDLGRIYKTKEELIKALKENKVPLRNDIVKILKNYFKI